jgi:hypothetical protein
MSMSRLFLGALVLAASYVAPVRADVLGTPPLFQASQTNAVCSLFNHGTPAVTFSLVRIMKDNGGPVPPTSSTCGGSLAPNKGCRIVANITAAFEHVCKVVTTNKAANLRAFLRIVNNAGLVLISTELR